MPVREAVAAQALAEVHREMEPLARSRGPRVLVSFSMMNRHPKAITHCLIIDTVLTIIASAGIPTEAQLRAAIPPEGITVVELSKKFGRNNILGAQKDEAFRRIKAVSTFDKTTKKLIPKT
jgi:hypothetical protein